MEGKVLLWLVVAACFWGGCMSRSHFPSLLRKVVNKKAGAYQVPSYAARMGGPNGYCMDVKEGQYHDGNSVVLWPCKSDKVMNQMWKFESDGTLRSNGKCLTADGGTEGSKITIYNCNTAAGDAKIWQMEESGVIMNRKSGLVLTAISPESGAGLTVETNTLSSFQTWRFGNLDWQRWVYIHVPSYGYMQASDTDVSVGDDNIRSQRFYCYPDGTVRPARNQGLCLSYDNLKDRRVVVIPCWLGPSSQRWLFTRSGTVLNERANLVMEVTDLKEIIVSPATVFPNQKFVLD